MPSSAARPGESIRLLAPGPAQCPGSPCERLWESAAPLLTGQSLAHQDTAEVSAMSVRTGRPTGRPRSTGVISKRGVHRRLDRDRGKASTQAAEWAFDEHSGYSMDLSRYRPMCHSCHKWYDKPAKGTSHAHHRDALTGRFVSV